MRVSVLQQVPRYCYDQLTETPDLAFLQEQSERTLDDTFWEEV